MQRAGSHSSHLRWKKGFVIRASGLRRTRKNICLQLSRISELARLMRNGSITKFREQKTSLPKSSSMKRMIFRLRQRTKSRGYFDSDKSWRFKNDAQR